MYTYVRLRGLRDQTINCGKFAVLPIGEKSLLRGVAGV